MRGRGQGKPEHTFLFHKADLELPTLARLVALLVLLAEDVQSDVADPDPVGAVAHHPVRRDGCVCYCEYISSRSWGIGVCMNDVDFLYRKIPMVCCPWRGDEE